MEIMNFNWKKVSKYTLISDGRAKQMKYSINKVIAELVFSKKEMNVALRVTQTCTIWTTTASCNLAPHMYLN